MSQALEVCGQVRQPGSFDFEALILLPGQIEDIATLSPGARAAVCAWPRY